MLGVKHLHLFCGEPMEITPISSSTRTLKVRTGKSSEPPPRKVAKTVTIKRKPKALAAPMAIDTADMSQMIATAAYFIAQQRSFAPGNEVSDWLIAEQQVKAMHT
jgi:hypothetical protein